LLIQSQKAPSIGDCFKPSSTIHDAIPTVAFRELEIAKKSYEGVLGLTKVIENKEVIGFKTGHSILSFIPRRKYFQSGYSTPRSTK